MANVRRGEVSAVLDGRERVLVLTLGALAELEAAFGAADLMGLAERFEAGRLSARDAILVLCAGLRGAGEDVTPADVERMRTDGGAAGFVRIVAALLAATFGGEAGAPEAGVPPRMPQGT